MNNSNNSSESLPANFTLEVLDTAICFYSDFDLADKGIGCSQREIGRCFKCEVGSGYFTGESIDDVTSLGHIICVVIWCLTIISGMVGIAANILIILIIQRKKSKNAFDFLLCVLALVDLTTCMAHIGVATLTTAYFSFENWIGRGVTALSWTLILGVTALLSKSISLFITSLITVERYIAIAYPFKAKEWRSLRRSKMYVAIVITLPILLNLPKYTSYRVGPNIYGEQDGGLDLLYMRNIKVSLETSKLYQLWDGSSFLLFIITYVFEHVPPFLILMIFNYLCYKMIRKVGRKRQKLSCTRRNELQATRMFIPVGIFFFISNIWPIITLIVVQIRGIFHREMWMGVLLSGCLNSTVNLWIYYFTGSLFRQETHAFISDIRKSWALKENE